MIVPPTPMAQMWPNSGQHLAHLGPDFGQASAERTPNSAGPKSVVQLCRSRADLGQIWPTPAQFRRTSAHGMQSKNPHGPRSGTTIYQHRIRVKCYHPGTHPNIFCALLVRHTPQDRTCNFATCALGPGMRARRGDQGPRATPRRRRTLKRRAPGSVGCGGERNDDLRNRRDRLGRALWVRAPASWNNGGKRHWPA